MYLFIFVRHREKKAAAKSFPGPGGDTGRENTVRPI